MYFNPFFCFQFFSVLKGEILIFLIIKQIFRDKVGETLFNSTSFVEAMKDIFL